MKQVFRRSMLLFLLLILLGGGVLVFCLRYVMQGGQWASFSANDHAFTDGQLSSGQILDRSGLLLYDAATGSYNDDPALRRATLHAVGDEENNISTSAKAALTRHLVGFDPITGTTGEGHKLYLSLDAQLCADALDALGWHKGTVGVYNYETGEILCMVSTPTFDPADPPHIEDGESAYEGVYLNRFLSAAYTPGSVFKIVTAAAALEQMPDVAERSFSCDGRLTIGDDVITCPHAHGDLDLYDAFARSCNGVFAQLAEELGGETMQKYAASAGLLSSQSINGIETAAGSYTISDSYELGWSGVGQFDDLVNPCAMMTLMGVIAGDGSAAAPRLIHRETGPLSLPVPTGGKDTVHGKWSPSTYEALHDMMAHSVDMTYGQSNFGDLSICAKSGTAEVGAGQTPHAWFTGFLDDPAHPLAFVVVVENGGGGAEVAGSIASYVLQQAVGNDD